MSTRAQGRRQGAADQASAEHHHPHLRALAVRALRSGALASLLSTLAVTAFSRARTGAPAAGTNAASQWFWYPHARHVRRLSPRYTLAGYAVHHASSLWWAGAFELLRPHRLPPRKRAAGAAGVAALAYLVDYHVVPRRLSPGFEHRIGRRGMCAAYAAFALGLYLGSRPAHVRADPDPVPARRRRPAARSPVR